MANSTSRYGQGSMCKPISSVATKHDAAAITPTQGSPRRTRQNIFLIGFIHQVLAKNANVPPRCQPLNYTIFQLTTLFSTVMVWRVKKKTYPTSLNLDADVRQMMLRARAAGRKFQHLCNEALRLHLIELGFSRRKK